MMERPGPSSVVHIMPELVSILILSSLAMDLNSSVCDVVCLGKLRHPKSGRLYTCRLCCAQEREMPMKDQDEPLDRYAVTEVMCMKCNTLQPAEDRCLNPSCQSQGKPYAKYFCRICHLYDDRSRPIFHCPDCTGGKLKSQNASAPKATIFC